MEPSKTFAANDQELRRASLKGIDSWVSHQSRSSALDTSRSNNGYVA